MSESNLTQQHWESIEEGDPAKDGRAFRRSLGQYATGVSVITAQHGEKQIGMAVNSFAAVSLDPPLVLWSIRRESYSLPAFLEASHFAVSVLSSDQADISQLFGAADPEKFNKSTWTAGRGGAPILDGAIAHFECRRDTVYECGDHLILIGHVERYARFSGDPLIFSQGQYAVRRSHPSLDATATATTLEAMTKRQETPFLTLLNVTSQYLSAQFQEHREAVGIDVASARILNRLFEGACGFDELGKATYLGPDTVDDALSELVAQGSVSQNSQAMYLLTPNGLQKREALTQRATEFQFEKLRGISATDLGIAQRVLLQLQQK